MINIERQIKYWTENSNNDFDTAKLLIENSKILHGLFFCHLVIEKMIKAHVVKQTKEIPPKSHNLLYLSERAKLKLNEDQELFIGILMKYQLEGRYPEYQPKTPSAETAKEYLLKSKEFLEWLENRL